MFVSDDHTPLPVGDLIRIHILLWIKRDASGRVLRRFTARAITGTVGREVSTAGIACGGFSSENRIIVAGIVRPLSSCTK